MQSPRNIPGSTEKNNATGKSIYDGGFSIKMPRLISIAGINRYGKTAYFMTSSLTKVDNKTSNIVIAFFPQEASVTVHKRNDVSTSDNAGYMADRCKKTKTQRLLATRQQA